MNNATSNYLRGLLSEKETWEKELEELALIERVPIMEPESMALVNQLIRLKQPVSILEIGTAIGYSALQMQHAYPSVHIVTIERDEHRYYQAKKHINSQRKEDKIRLIYGDALDVLSELPEHTFDVAFIDAAKGQYKRFFERIGPLLKEKALVISDNVLFKGYVSEDVQTNPRYEKIAEKMKRYNTWLTAHTQYDTSIIPIGDGVAISLKK